LTSLSLANNQLTGTLPASWAEMESLEILHLHGNQFTGDMPNEWAALRAIEKFTLNDNYDMRLDCNRIFAMTNEWEELKIGTVDGSMGPCCDGNVPNFWQVPANDRGETIECATTASPSTSTPTVAPSYSPSVNPSFSPSVAPSLHPTTSIPTEMPTDSPVFRQLYCESWFDSCSDSNNCNDFVEGDIPRSEACCQCVGTLGGRFKLPEANTAENAENLGSDLHTDLIWAVSFFFGTSDSSEREPILKIEYEDGRGDLQGRRRLAGMEDFIWQENNAIHWKFRVSMNESTGIREGSTDSLKHYSHKKLKHENYHSVVISHSVEKVTVYVDGSHHSETPYEPDPYTETDPALVVDFDIEGTGFTVGNLRWMYHVFAAEPAMSFHEENKQNEDWPPPPPPTEYFVIAVAAGFFAMCVFIFGPIAKLKGADLPNFYLLFTVSTAIIDTLSDYQMTNSLFQANHYLWPVCAGCIAVSQTVCIGIIIRWIIHHRSMDTVIGRWLHQNFYWFACISVLATTNVLYMKLCLSRLLSFGPVAWTVMPLTQKQERNLLAFKLVNVFLEELPLGMVQILYLFGDSGDRNSQADLSVQIALGSTAVSCIMAIMGFVVDQNNKSHDDEKQLWFTIENPRKNLLLKTAKLSKPFRYRALVERRDKQTFRVCFTYTRATSSTKRMKDAGNKVLEAYMKTDEYGTTTNETQITVEMDELAEFIDNISDVVELIGSDNPENKVFFRLVKDENDGKVKVMVTVKNEDLNLELNQKFLHESHKITFGDLVNYNNIPVNMGGDPDSESLDHNTTAANAVVGGNTRQV